MTLPLPSRSRPWIVGHRGAAGEAPENSLESFLLAVDQGADMVELDLQLTSDHVLVATHDWDLQRLASLDLVVENQPVGRLRYVDPREGDPAPGKERRIPTLEEILDALPLDLPLNLELKRQRADRPALARALADEIGARGSLLISSFDWELLRRVRKTAPSLPVAPLAKVGWLELLRAADELQASSIHCHWRMVRPSLMAAARDRRLPVLAYTVNQVRHARRLIDAGVAGLFSDHPGRLRTQLKGQR